MNRGCALFGCVVALLVLQSAIAGCIADTGQKSPGIETAIITVQPIPEYPAGKTITISGTTTLPVGEVLDIAWIKEPFHTTKCDPGKFCGSGTNSTLVVTGKGENVWSFDLNTSGFTAGGYSIWVVAKNSPNTSANASFSLRRE